MAILRRGKLLVSQALNYRAVLRKRCGQALSSCHFHIFRVGFKSQPGNQIVFIDADWLSSAKWYGIDTMARCFP
jgi:hypothetical protein